jgi:ABC-type dipeptide/oligopeptide/nickel transport system permease component
MRTYILGRLLPVPTMLLAITVIVFVTAWSIPKMTTGPLIVEIDVESMESTEETRAFIRQQSAISVPFQIQYLRWMGLAKQQDGRYSGLLQGDLGDPIWDWDH